MTNKNEVVEALKRAREHVADKWVQGDYEIDGGCCAVGAVRRATGYPENYGAYQFYRALIERLRTASSPEILVIHQWNDAPGRTQAEVLALFDKAIELAA